MKFIIVAAVALVAVAAALPVENSAAQTLRSEYAQDPAGSYHFNFETDNGINRIEAGELKQVTDAENKPQTVVVVRGTYTYTDETGKVETINYYADENGYHAEGPSVPARR